MLDNSSLSPDQASATRNRWLPCCVSAQTTDIIIQFPTNLFSHLGRVSYPEYLHLVLLLLHVAVDVAAGDAGLGPGLVSQDILLEELEQSWWNIHHLSELRSHNFHIFVLDLYLKAPRRESWHQRWLSPIL